MADISVCFSGSSSEEIEQAKRLWQTIYPVVKPKSALIIKGIDHRLRTAPLPQKDINYAHQSISELEALDHDPALDRYRQDAEKQRIAKEEDYKTRINDSRKESQNLFQKRRQERKKKEEISSRILHQTHDRLMQFSDSEEENEDAQQAMDDIEKFEAKLRQQEKLKPS